MTKRVCWKRGMRLTDDILRASDNCNAELVTNAFVLATAGRFGLFPSAYPFEVSLDIANGIVDVVSLDCKAITKGGNLIDVHYDTKYSNSIETRVRIPDNQEAKEYILLVNAEPDQWLGANDIYEVPTYTFSLIASNTPIPDNSMPIARIGNEYGWHIDDINFVPPCLFVSSHPKYLELLKQFAEILSSINSKAVNLLNSNGKDVIRVFWPIIQQLMITVNKECDLMTPMTLLSNVQKFVSAFTCACELDDNLELTDSDTFRNYVFAPYNYKDAYQKIKEGIELCFSISEKVEKLSEVKHVSTKLPSPTIDSEHLVKRCTSPQTSIPINYTNLEATVYFTIDGSDPSISSARAQRGKKGLMISFKNGFVGSSPEPDKTIVVKLKAMTRNSETETGEYHVRLKKDPRTFIEI